MEGIVIVGGLALVLAWVNGANDVSRGVATLAGSGTASARRAILWGTLWTVVGGAAALLWGSALIKTFGTDLVAPGFTPSWTFAASVLGGACSWVALASYRGWPVSTTHALLGGLVGSVLATVGVEGLRVAAVSYKAVLPLLVSPFLAILLCAVLMSMVRLVRWQVRRSQKKSGQRKPFSQSPHSESNLMPGQTTCRAWTTLHWISSGVTSFARALNDVPKIAAFVSVAVVMTPGGIPLETATIMGVTIIMVTAVMGVGSIWGGRRVLQMLAHRVAAVESSTGLVANFGTSVLVLGATPFGLPVSTTHVSAGSLMGIRWVGRARPEVDALNGMLIAWLVTIPAAAVVGALTSLSFSVLE